MGSNFIHQLLCEFYFVKWSFLDITGDIIPDVDNINTKSSDSEDKMDLGSDPTNSTTSSSNRYVSVIPFLNLFHKEDMETDQITVSI